jgi:hypothetical protein
MASFPHPFSQTHHPVYIFHCMVHGLKAMRNNLEKSRNNESNFESLTHFEGALEPQIISDTARNVKRTENTRKTNSAYHRTDFIDSNMSDV